MTGKRKRGNPNGRPRSNQMKLEVRKFFFPDDPVPETGQEKLDKYLWLLRDNKIPYNKPVRDTYEYNGEDHIRVEITVDEEEIKKFKEQNKSLWMEGDYE